jgi:hypothetical protein
MHDDHASLRYYDPSQILVDSCQECEWNSTHPAATIINMDAETFQRTWKRAIDYERLGNPAVSYTEIPILTLLWGVARQLETRGIPLGGLPGKIESSDDLKLAGC